MALLRRLVLLMLCSFALASTAQQPPFSRCNANNVNATIIGNGTCYTYFNYSTLLTCPTWEVPVGSGKSTIFQHALWFGGLDSDDSLHLAAFRFGQLGEDFWTGPLTTTDASTDLMSMLKHYHVWNLSRAEINDFIAHHGEPGYEAPDDILTWPAHGSVEITRMVLADWISRNCFNVDGNLVELFRRTVFNIAVSNCDDHLRNHGFLLTQRGWELSPAYDINPNPEGQGLSLNISDTDNSLDFELAMDVAPLFRVGESDALAIRKKVSSVVARWRKYASGAGIGHTEQDVMATAFRAAQ